MSNIKQITVNNNTYNLYDSTAARSIVLNASTDDLNNITTPGIYSCGGGNSIKNKPSGTDGIGVIVVHNATSNYYTQILTTSSNANTYRRTCLNGTWSAWTIDKYTDTTYSLPTASASVKGGVKIGSNLSMNGDVLNATNTTYSAATQSAAGLMSAADKTKLDGIASGANKYTYTLPTAGSSVLGGVKIGTTLTNSSGQLQVVTTKLTTATRLDPGIMSSSDKTKLDNIEAHANNYSLPSATTTVIGGVKVGSNITVTNGTISLTKANVTTALGYTPPTTNTTYGSATTTNLGLIRVGTTIVRDSDGKYNVVTSKLLTASTASAGLMSAEDKKKLNNIAAGANNYSLPVATSSSLGGIKVGSNLSISSGVLSATYNVATTTTNGLMSSTDKTKLDGLSNAPSMAMGVRGTVPGTPSVSDTSNQNRYLSGGTNGQGEWRALPSIAWDGSGLGKSFKQYKTGAEVPSGCGTAATAPTVNTVSSTEGRYYGVESDLNNRLFVNVPWTDTVGVTGTSVTKLCVLTPSAYNTATKNSNEIYFILE